MWFIIVICFVTKISCIEASLQPQCPEKVPVENFDIHGIGRGIWYEVARYPYPCRKPVKFLVYESRMEGDLYIAETINVDRSSPYFTEVFSRLLPDPRKRGKISFEFSSSERGVLIESPVMYILGVDYDKFFVAYTCVYDESQNEIREHAWVLSRSKPIPGKVKEEFMEITRNAGLDEDKLIWYEDILSSE